MACHPRGHRLLDGGDNVGIGAAAADVAAHQFADLIDALGLAFGDQAGRRTDLPRRAIAALKCIMIDEGLLQRVQRAVFGQALDRGDVGAVLHHGQCQAGVEPPSVDQDCTSAALSVIAAFFRACQVEAITQRVEQGCPRRHLQLSLFAVDMKRNGDRGRRSDFFRPPSLH